MQLWLLFLSPKPKITLANHLLVLRKFAMKKLVWSLFCWIAPVFCRCVDMDMFFSRQDESSNFFLRCIKRSKKNRSNAMNDFLRLNRNNDILYLYLLATFFLLNLWKHFFFACWISWLSFENIVSLSWRTLQLTKNGKESKKELHLQQRMGTWKKKLPHYHFRVEQFLRRVKPENPRYCCLRGVAENGSWHGICSSLSA